MSVTIQPIHIGEAIDNRRQALGINKSELARRINVPQQHINRILSNSSMDTEKLAKISEALEFNFFDLFASVDRRTEASTPTFIPPTPLSEKATSEKVTTETLSSPTSHFETTSPTMKDLTIQMLQEKNRMLEELIESKNRIIDLLEEKLSPRHEG
ncbi:protein containing Helix-turn-helix type 3 domain protein [gut metagenome]|uniref:Protein containing Helix-turn-helix type 3 domain protein n=1 Tax=gut metagenome TaxID=749906 RepID=J9G297_9ZZZZ